ncbi:MAG: S-layer homology domain-containing protein [Cellulosilyticaceae bacterium]
MKKFKTKMMAGILAATVAMQLYGVEVAPEQGQTEGLTPSEVTQMQEGSQTEHLTDAMEAFEESGMVNLFTRLSRREQKKWDKQINIPGVIREAVDIPYQISGIYEIGVQQYYVLGWGENVQQEADGIFQLILTQEDDQYFTTYHTYPSETILTVEALALYQVAEQEESNVTIAYDEVNQLSDVGEYVEYLDEAITQSGQEAINDTAKDKVTQYVQYAIEELASESMTAEDNTIRVEVDLLGQMKEGVVKARRAFESLLKEKEVSFNKDLNTILKVQTQKVDFKKPIIIELPQQFDRLEEITGLRILLDDQSYIYIESKDFNAVAGLTIKLERMKDKKTYDITFLSPEGEVIPQLDQTITFALPAKDEFTTVVASYSDEEQNWGGQYDVASKTIAFGTKYTGKYKIVDHTVKIKDIVGLPSKQQSAIKFMVSKGYLTLENERFNPQESFTRYEFAEALVKMFFALDTSLTTSLKDVPEESPYYPYVASGETYEIIKGYEDGTFKGDVAILREHVLSLCARTIADQKGYIYPEKIEDYIKFADVNQIGGWAIQDIALAVQSGLINGGGVLAPKAEITKAESAEILYKLFMLLYETTPGDLAEITVSQTTYAIGAIILVALLLLWLIGRLVKKNKVIITMIICTGAIILTMIIGFKGGF